MFIHANGYNLCFSLPVCSHDATQLQPPCSIKTLEVKTEELANKLEGLSKEVQGLKTEVSIASEKTKRDRFWLVTISVGILGYTHVLAIPREVRDVVNDQDGILRALSTIKEQAEKDGKRIQI